MWKITETGETHPDLILIELKDVRMTGTTHVDTAYDEACAELPSMWKNPEPICMTIPCPDFETATMNVSGPLCWTCSEPLDDAGRCDDCYRLPPA